MKEIWKNIDTYVKIGFLTSLLLIVISFFIPPVGVVDGSVIAAVGEIDGFASILVFLYKLPQYIAAGMSAKITRGETQIELSGKQKEGVE